MPSLRELKKRLQSISTSRQLAGAMKTVSSARLSALGKSFDNFIEYRNAIAAVARSFGSSLNALFPQSGEACICYVVLSSNKGLCGGYNNDVLEYALKEISSCAVPYKLVLCGSKSSAFFSQKHGETFKEHIIKEFILSDTPSFDDCVPLCEYVKSLYESGNCSEVRFIYQKYENVMKQTPTVYRLLPFEQEGEESEVLFVPDRLTVSENAYLYCVGCTVYSIVLEGAMGAAGATLMAMRTAYDNANDASQALENEISRKRQSEVTSSVIETSSENLTKNFQ